MKLILFLFIVTKSINADNLNDQVCDKESCTLKPIFDYQRNIDWSDKSKDLWHWIQSQKGSKAVTFCKEDSQYTNNEQAVKPIVGPFDCAQSGGMNFVKFDGTFDQDNLLKGNGRALNLRQPESGKTGNNCYDMLPSITQVTGRFVKGQLDNKATLNYNDGTKMEANFKNGVIQGKVKIINRDGKTQAIGLYEQGLPHGPFWFIHDNGYVQAHFDKGHLVEENVIMVEHDHEWAMIGKLVNQTYLVEAHKIDVDWNGYYRCMQVIRIPKELTGEPLKTRLKLPVKIVPMLQEHKIMVRPSKIMFFNRVAKTGSQSFIKLMKTLGLKLGYEVDPGVRQVEAVVDSFEGVMEEVGMLLNTHDNRVKVRHYSFFDLTRFGYQWAPDWFTLVRDPIDKIISFFYYKRASWNVVARKIAFPDEPWPEIDFLKLDFDTCVLEHMDECNFDQDSDPETGLGHKSQITQFCGHENPVCRKFNNPGALELAKRNVEKYYQVVGVTDNMNMTLDVLEAKLPEYFAGAKETYTKSKDVKKFQWKNNYKLPVTDQVMEILKKNFTQEIEFYEFCKQRLQVQHEELFKVPN